MQNGKFELEVLEVGVENTTMLYGCCVAGSTSARK